MTRGWHLSGSNQKPHFFGKDMLYGHTPQSICKRVSGYSGITLKSCYQLFKKESSWKPYACKQCLRLRGELPLSERGTK